VFDLGVGAEPNAEIITVTLAAMADDSGSCRFPGPPEVTPAAG
jgi:hypothetical protein